MSDVAIDIGSATMAVLGRFVGAARSFVSRRERIAAAAERLSQRFPALMDMSVRLAVGDPHERYAAWIAQYDTLTAADLAAIKDDVRIKALRPLSLIVPVSQGSEHMLDALTKSLVEQAYEHFDVTFLCVESVVPMARNTDDGRFRWLTSKTSALAEAWNTAVRNATGEFVVFVDPGVQLRPHTLFLFALEVARSPDAVLVYADDDALDPSGSRTDHYFKPDWNEALLRGQNYLGGVVCLRRSRALEVGGCGDEVDGDGAWGLFLRVTAGEPRGTIHHLPYVLSHRPRETRGPTDVVHAHRRRLASLGYDAEVEPVGAASYHLVYELPAKPPTVSVIVPSTCRLEVLRPCLDGLFDRTTYPRLEVVVVANGLPANHGHQVEYLRTVAAQPCARVLFYDGAPYNFSEINNWAAAQARGELLCFLNDDTEVIGPGWLSALVSHVLQDRVGAAGALLLYPNGRVQHAGVVLGAGGVAAHAYKGCPRGTRGYHDRALVAQDVSCVSAACILVRRAAFEEAGGFDPALAITYNDVDLCLRLREAGWRIVWEPGAELFHQESVSLGRHNLGGTREQWAADEELIRSRWGEQLASDPHHNSNLSLDALALEQPAFPPRVFYPWRAPAVRATTAYSPVS
jgi:GT2 family glycosyltransferase